MTVEPNVVAMSIEAGVGMIVFDRPVQQNVWTPGMSEQYSAALETCARDPAVRVIVVTGAGGHWCAGGDGAVLTTLANVTAVTVADRPLPYLAMLVAKPVIAAIPGVCFGIGLFQALCCDIRFAAADVKFSTAYARRGLPAETGTSWLLPRIVGRSRAADLLFSARIVRADEALRIGLIDRVVDESTLIEETLAYAREMAARSAPESLRIIKRQLHDDAIGGFADAFARAEVLLADASTSADFREGVASWQERRPPEFAPVSDDFGLLASATRRTPPAVWPNDRERCS